MHNLNFEIANALYIHIPFCSRKCPYCDFYSIKYTKKRVDQYWAALFMELEEISQKVDNKLLQSIYIGGGTPSLIDPFLLAELIKKIKKSFILSQSAEITIEVNPTSITEEKLIKLKRAGINRLSVGIQSFNDDFLKLLGRESSSQRNKEVLKLINKHFQNYSADLIFALPGQKLADFKNDLEQMLKFKPPHISLYNLEIHENTPFFQKEKQGKLVLPKEEVDSQMYKTARNILDDNDYLHYEISNFAKKGFRARHNYIYWLYQPYLALGPGAAGFDGSRRYQNIRNFDQYLEYYNPDNTYYNDNNKKQDENYKVSSKENINIREIDKLSKKEQMAEYCFLSLRTTQGLFYHKFYQRFKIDIKSIYNNSILELINKGLIKEGNNRIYLTEKGKELANEVFIKFLP